MGFLFWKYLLKKKIEGNYYEHLCIHTVDLCCKVKLETSGNLLPKGKFKLIIMC
jgi:hypothetical protein